MTSRKDVTAEFREVQMLSCNESLVSGLNYCGVIAHGCKVSARRRRRGGGGVAVRARARAVYYKVIHATCAAARSDGDPHN